VREKYEKGVCEFPGGAASAAAERLAEELAAIALRLANGAPSVDGESSLGDQLCEQLTDRRAA